MFCIFSAKRWVVNCRRQDLESKDANYLSKNCRLCSLHFEKIMFANFLQNRLKPDAVPTLFTVPNPPKQIGNKRKLPVGRNALSSSNGDLQEVCERHFQPHEIERFTSAFDSRTGRLLAAPLETPRLKQGAAPSKLPDFSAALPTPSPTRECAEDDSQNLDIFIDPASENSSYTMSEDGRMSEDGIMLMDERMSDNFLCRICGQEESDLTSLYGPSAIEMGLLRKIEENLKIKIDKNSCLPTQICKKCISKLDFCDRFINIARNANIRLHEMYAVQTQNELSEACHYCDKKFRSPSLLSMHLTTHSTATLFLCEFCGRSFKNRDGLICHKRTHLDLSKKKRHACSSCDRKFRSRFDLLEHAYWHSGATPYTCSSCGKAFHRRALLHQHSLVHRAGTMLKNTCAKCGKAFSRYSDLRMHMRRHEIGRTFKCSVCSLSFPTINALLSHRKQHQSLSNNSNSELKLPTNKSPNLGKEGKFRCEDCGKQLSGRSALSYHRKAFHGGSKDWRCEQCGKTFLSEGLKRIHEHTHSEVQPFRCTVCNKSFKNPNVLNQHLKDHLDTPAFECPHCGKWFKRKAALGVHLRIHTGQRPFACDMCQRTFTQKNDKLKHVACQHSQLTKFPQLVCEFCSCKFNDSSELNEHKERIHILTID